MSRVAHSPPTKKNVESDPFEAMSECDTANSEREEQGRSKPITTSKKKRRLENSPKNEFQLFRDEIKEMFSTWRAEQNRNQEKQYKKMLSQFNEIKQERLDLQKSIEFLSSKVDDYRIKVEEYQTTIKLQQEYNSILESKIHDLELVSRSASIEIRNIPVKDKESLEDLTSVVINTGKVLSMNVDSKEIRDVYRVPGKSGSVRPIVAEFNKVSLKSDMLSAVRKFNSNRKLEEKLNTELLGYSGKRSSVFVSEHLPAFSRQLFYQSREFARQHGFKFCWTSNGQILLRQDNGTKLIQVKSKKSLEEISQLK